VTEYADALRAALGQAIAEVGHAKYLLAQPHASLTEYVPRLAEARGVARGLARAIELLPTETPTAAPSGLDPTPDAPPGT
jgi:hypothetical protein